MDKLKNLLKAGMSGTQNRTAPSISMRVFSATWKNYIIAICENEPECWHALELARTNADRLIPGHDPRVLSLYPGGLVA